MIDRARAAGADYKFLVDKLTALKQAGNNAGIDDVDNTPNTLNNDSGGNSGNFTALHYAVSMNDPDIIRALCTRGANKEVKETLYGGTPLYYAVVKEMLNALQALLDQPGIDVNAKDGLGMTPLMQAASNTTNNNLPILRVLLQQPGIDVNAKDNDGKTALMYAVTSHNLDTLKALLDQPGIDVNAKDNVAGKTALMYAVEEALLNFVEELLKKADVVANINQQDSAGQTALANATDSAIKKALTDKGAS